MKLNKLKLSIIAIATIVASNTNAQTFYQCVPNGCPDGQYFDGEKCLPLLICDAGYIKYKGKCCKEEYKIIIPHSSAPRYTITKKGVKLLPSEPFYFKVDEYQTIYSVSFTIPFDDCATLHSERYSSISETCWQCVEAK